MKAWFYNTQNTWELRSHISKKPRHAFPFLHESTFRELLYLIIHHVVTWTYDSDALAISIFQFYNFLFVASIFNSISCNEVKSQTSQHSAFSNGKFCIFLSNTCVINHACFGRWLFWMHVCNYRFHRSRNARWLKGSRDKNSLQCDNDQCRLLACPLAIFAIRTYMYSVVYHCKKHW